MKNKKIIFLIAGAAITISLTILGMSLVERPEIAAPIYITENKAEDLVGATDKPDTAEPQTPEKTKTGQPKPQNPATPSPDSMSATVIAGEEAAALSFADGDTFYDALIGARNEGKLQFSGKNYTGLGFLVTEIDSLRAGGGKYLLYYINGEEATVGVSSYMLNDGDVLEWKLE